jgi:hypothetical protein
MGSMQCKQSLWPMNVYSVRWMIGQLQLIYDYRCTYLNNICIISKVHMCTAESIFFHLICYRVIAAFLLTPTVQSVLAPCPLV